MSGYCPECGNLALGCEIHGCAPLAISKTVVGSLWANCYLMSLKYRQAEPIAGIRRSIVDLAYFREVNHDVDGTHGHINHVTSLGHGGSRERGEALIQMLEYNNSARAHGPGWINNRNEDIKYIQEKYLS